MLDQSVSDTVQTNDQSSLLDRGHLVHPVTVPCISLHDCDVHSVKWCHSTDKNRPGLQIHYILYFAASTPGVFIWQNMVYKLNTTVFSIPSAI